MRRMTRLSVAFVGFACVAGVLASSRAEAQGGFGSWATAGIFGGVVIPSGELSDEAGRGWHAGALAKIKVFGPLDLRVDGTYTKLGKKDLVGTTRTVITDGVVTFGTVNALINLGVDSAEYPGDNAVSPYIVAGAGVYRLDFRATCGGDCATFFNPPVDSFPGLNFGGGATVPVAGLRTFVEGRYHRVSRSLLEGGARTFVLVSAGIKFR